MAVWLFQAVMYWLTTIFRPAKWGKTIGKGYFMLVCIVHVKTMSYVMYFIHSYWHCEASSWISQEWLHSFDPPCQFSEASWPEWAFGLWSLKVVKYQFWHGSQLFLIFCRIYLKRGVAPLGITCTYLYTHSFCVCCHSRSLVPSQRYDSSSCSGPQPIKHLDSF